MIALMAQFFSIMAGQSSSAHYGTVFLSQVGGINAFTGTVIKRAGCARASTNIFVIERLGRRMDLHAWGTTRCAIIRHHGGFGLLSTRSPGNTSWA